MFKRVRWQPLVVLAPILLLGAMGTCLIYIKARQRTTYVSKVISGYRCRFTLPAVWTRYEVPPPADFPKGAGVDYVLTSPHLNPVDAWIYRRCYPRVTSPTVNVGADDPGRMRIYLGVFAEKYGRSSITSFKDGYPEPFLWSGERVLAERHLMVDGCPVTLVKKEWMSPHRRHPWMWIACTPDHSVQFEATGVSEQYDEEKMDHEMETVLSSLHFEKVAAPTGGKR